MDNNKLELLLGDIAKTLKLSLEEVMSLYTYYGDDLFFLLKFLAGKTVRFPTTSPVVEFFERIQDFQILDIKSFIHIEEPNCLISPKLLKQGDKFTYQGKEYLVEGTPIHFEEQYLAVVKSVPEEK